MQFSEANNLNREHQLCPSVVARLGSTAPLSFTTGSYANTFSVGGGIDGKRRDGVVDFSGPMNSLEAEEFAYLRRVAAVRGQVSKRGGWVGMGFPPTVPAPSPLRSRTSSRKKQASVTKNTSLVTPRRVQLSTASTPRQDMDEGSQMSMSMSVEMDMGTGADADADIGMEESGGSIDLDL